ncbi:hypothetical protein [Mesorhizobium sp. SP-1A]|uniref:hypothetical protein n=1 Tax=Mesorhizobium sp. SP-1A TaxID=3077840 RepID=UPI0028F7344B|nr:hypothetical protein [Mesorhizobium sp. SP-1A]
MNFDIDSKLLMAIAVIVFGPSLIMIEGAWSRARLRKKLEAVRAERIKLERELQESQAREVEA